MPRIPSFFVFLWAVLALVHTPRTSFCQKEEYIGFSTGLLYCANQDIILSPYIQKGVQIPAALLVEIKSDKYQLLESVMYASGSLRSTADNTLTLRQMNLHLAYLRYLSNEKAVRPLMGLSWNTSQVVTRQSFVNSYEETGSLASALAVHARFEKNAGKHRWLLDLDQSLFGYVVRSSYGNGPPDQDLDNPSFAGYLASGTWAGPGEFWQTNLLLSWESNLSVRWKFRTTGTFSYRHIGMPEDYTSSTVNTGVQAAILYRFHMKRKGDEQK